MSGESSYSVARVVLATAPVDKALAGIIMGAGVIWPPRPGAMAPCIWQRTWTLRVTGYFL